MLKLQYHDCLHCRVYPLYHAPTELSHLSSKWNQHEYKWNLFNLEFILPVMKYHLSWETTQSSDRFYIGLLYVNVWAKTRYLLHTCITHFPVGCNYLSWHVAMCNDTVETLYNTVIFCWSTHKRHSIARPKGRGMGCLLWVQRATYCVDLSKLSSIKY